MPSPERPSHRPLTRADLPAELTPETLRGLSFITLRQLADHRNGVLDASEQQQFDAALPEVMRETASRVNEAGRRVPHGGPGPLDPTLRRSYERNQQRLAEQTRRAAERFPELALDHPNQPAEGSAPAEASTTAPPEGSTTTVPTIPITPLDDDVSPSILEQEVQQTSETLDMLEKIASLEQRQLEHQEGQLLTDTRGVFFAFLVSVAVIVAGIAPLVEAEPRERLLIMVWTIGVIAAAGLVYVLVRRVQGTPRRPDVTSAGKQ